MTLLEDVAGLGFAPRVSVQRSGRELDLVRYVSIFDRIETRFRRLR